jgi:WD40 repeat protein
VAKDGTLTVTELPSGKVIWARPTLIRPTVHVRDGVPGLTVSPDGRLLGTTLGVQATGKPPGVLSEVQLWEMETGKLIDALTQNDTGSNYGSKGLPSFSPDGKLLAIPTVETPLQWDFGAKQTRPLTHVSGNPAYKGFDVQGGSVGFMPDGTGVFDGGPALAMAPSGAMYAAIISNSSEKDVGLYSAKSLRPLVTLIGHSGVVRHLAFLQNGTRLLSAGEDGVIKVWEVRTGTELLSLKVTDGGIVGLRVHRDDSSFSVAFSTGKVETWSVPVSPPFADWGLVAKGNWVYSLKWDKAGKRLAASTGERNSVFEMPHGRLAWSLGWQELGGGINARGSVAPIAFAPDGRHAISGGPLKGINTYESGTGKATSISIEADRGLLGAAEYTPDGKRLLSLFYPKEKDFATKSFVIMEMPSRKELVSTDPGFLDAFTQSPDGKVVAVGDRVVIRLFDTVTGKETGVLPRPADQRAGDYWPGQCLSISPDGRLLAAHLRLNFVQVWDIRSGAVVAKLADKMVKVSALAFSPDGRWLATAGEGERVRVWDVKTWKLRGTLQGQKSEVTALAFHPEGRWLATGGEDGRVLLWDLTVALPAVTSPKKQ